MARYAELADLARVATRGWSDLAQRAAQDARVTGELLRTLAEGGDTSAWAPEAVALAEAALMLLEDTLDRASRHADTYITPRLAAPLTPELVAASDLPTVVATIAWRRLFGTPVQKEMIEGTRWADDYLRDFAAGRVSLGRTDVQSSDPDVWSHFEPRQITDETLKGF